MSSSTGQGFDTGELRRQRADGHPTTPPPHHQDQHDQGRPWAIAAWISALVALFFVPIITGPAGMAFGYVAHRKGHPHGRTAMIVAAIATVAGIVLSYIVVTTAGMPPSG